MIFCCKCRRKTGLLSFQCIYCHQHTCVHHRLPEDHDCACIEDVKNIAQTKNKLNLESNAVREMKIDRII